MWVWGIGLRFGLWGLDMATAHISTYLYPLFFPNCFLAMAAEPVGREESGPESRTGGSAGYHPFASRRTSQPQTFIFVLAVAGSREQEIALLVVPLVIGSPSFFLYIGEYYRAYEWEY